MVEGAAKRPLPGVCVMVEGAAKRPLPLPPLPEGPLPPLPWLPLPASGLDIFVFCVV
jgi:hypothetical protein